MMSSDNVVRQRCQWVAAAEQRGGDPAMAKRHQARTARPLAALRQGRNDWYKMRNLSASAAEILVYDEIGFWGVTANDFIRDLRDLNATEITLRINSPGGEIFDG